MVHKSETEMLHLSNNALLVQQQFAILPSSKVSVPSFITNVNYLLADIFTMEKPHKS